MPTLPVDILERDWQRELVSRDLAERFRDWSAAEPALAPFTRPASLMRYLSPATPAARKDMVLCALLRCARRDPAAARLVLQTLLPGVRRRIARALLEADECEEVWSAVLDRVWQRIRSYPVERLPHHVASNLALTAVRQVLEGRERDRRFARRMLCGAPSAELPDADRSESDIDALLGRAIKDGAITGWEAELIARTRIDGVPLTRYACTEGAAYDALRMARRRAEQRLVAHLEGDGTLGSACSV